LAYDPQAPQCLDECRTTSAAARKVDVDLCQIEWQLGLVYENEWGDCASRSRRRPLDTVAPQLDAELVPKPRIAFGASGQAANKPTRNVSRKRTTACRLGDFSDRGAWHYRSRLERILSLSHAELG
jgi:hypothetical protein